jgi:hypothetical protein
MRGWRTLNVLLLVCAGLGALPTAGPPFGAGERLIYGVKANGLGGHATMAVRGPVDVRGTETYMLQFDVHAGLGPVKGTNRTESWLDTRRMAALRFRAYEHRPFSTHEQKVEMYPDERRWTAQDGTSGTSASDAPLDELSFIYFIRSLPLDSDSTLTFDRYFDATRNPTLVRVVGRDSVATDAGIFAALVVEMDVRDPRHYQGQGSLRLFLSDDDCRIPVRIESRMPNVGTVVFTLKSYQHPSGPCAASRP